MPAVTGETAPPAEQLAADPLLLRPIRAEDKRLRLRGPPNDLVGIVTLARGAEPTFFGGATPPPAIGKAGYRRRLTEAKLVSSSVPAAPGGDTALRFATEIPPETSAKVAARLAVPRTTPPGVYKAVFDIGGEPREAELEVLAEEQLDIGPSGLALSGAPGAVVGTELLFTNRGNVPLVLDVLGGLILEDLEPLCLSVQRALAQVRDKECQDDAHRFFLDALVKNVADKRADMGRARIAGGPATLEPGNSALLGVELHFPANLAPGRGYRATLQYRGGRVSLRIDTVAPARGALKRNEEAL